MPFDSRKQQQWYNATDQTFLDDEPSSARQVTEMSSLGNKMGDFADTWNIGNQRKNRQKKRYDQIEQDIDLSSWGLEDADEGVLDIFDEFATTRKNNRLGDLEERELMMSEDETPELEAEITVESIEDMGSSWGTWTEQPASMTRDEEMNYYKNMGMSRRTLKDMGYGDLIDSFAQQDEEHEVFLAVESEPPCPYCGSHDLGLNVTTGARYCHDCHKHSTQDGQKDNAGVMGILYSGYG